MGDDRRGRGLSAAQRAGLRIAGWASRSRSVLRIVWQLPPAERRLGIEVAALLLGIRLLLLLLPLGMVQRILTRPIAGRTADPTYAERIGRTAAALAPPLLGDAPCLVQALAVHALLRRHGQPSRLHIGVRKGQRGRLEAHAWVECDGAILIGGPAALVTRFQPLARHGAAPGIAHPGRGVDGRVNPMIEEGQARFNARGTPLHQDAEGVNHPDHRCTPDAGPLA